MNTPTDSDMLDWLDNHDGAIEGFGFGEYRWYLGDHWKSAREIISGAMQGKEGIARCAIRNMKERGIIFSAAMVRAVLENRKTQTRRIITPEPPKWAAHWRQNEHSPAIWWMDDELNDRHGREINGRKCPYGVAGDRLWFKENYTVLRFEKERGLINPRYIYYRLVGRYTADQKLFSIQLDHRESKLFAKRMRKLGGQSGRFMYRSLARIWRDLTGVRVERLQDISEADVLSEGLVFHPDNRTNKKSHYAALWDSLHGKGAWERNDWAWVLEFKKITPTETILV